MWQGGLSQYILLGEGRGPAVFQGHNKNETFWESLSFSTGLPGRLKKKKKHPVFLSKEAVGIPHKHNHGVI